MTTSGRASRMACLASQEVEVLGRGGRVDDADVALGAERQEALEPRRRVLRARSLVAVRQQQGQARGLPPLGEAGDEELVDDDLGPVDEVAVLRLPQDERLGGGDRVAVLEAEAGVLGQRRVVELEAGARAGQVLERDVPLAGASRRTAPAWRWLKVPRTVSWPVSRIGVPSRSSDAKASSSAWPQSIARLVARRARRRAARAACRAWDGP